MSPLRTLVPAGAFLVAASAPAYAASASGPGRLIGLSVTLAAALLLALPTVLLLRLSLPLTGRAAEVFAARPWISRLLGAADLLLVLFVASAAKGRAALTGVALVLLLALLILTLLGLAGAAIRVGRQLAGREGGAGAFVLAWLVLATLPLLPVVGPLYLLWIAAGGVGSVILALAPGRGASAAGTGP